MGAKHSQLKECGYTLLKEIEEGGTLKAFQIRNNIDKRDYIAKIVNLENITKDKKCKIKEELVFLLNMIHPHIVQYRESLEDENLYIVMEYCDGGTLAEKIEARRKKSNPFTEQQILYWFIQICLAMKYIHDKNILHKDIKPQNIFLTKDDTIKLGDFGIAKVLNRKEEYTKTKPGTPFYVAPEVWKGKPFDNKSDIWALGCLLYELCTLDFAFSPKEHLLFMFELWNQVPVTISEDFSPELRSLVDELLQKDPRFRPSIDDILQKPFLDNLIPKHFKLSERKRKRHLMIRTPTLTLSNDDQSVSSGSYDRNIKYEISLLSESIEIFRKLYDQNFVKIHKLVKELKKVADDLERVHFGTTVGSLTGGVVGAAGGITSIVGLALAPFTLGASLIVTGVGIGVAVAGGATSAASNITNMASKSTDRKNIERIINEYREKMEPILISVENIIRSMEILQRSENIITTANMMQAGLRAGRGLGGIAELVRLVQVVNMGKVAAHAARGVRVAGVFSGVLSGLFLALDVYFIFKDAKELHSLRKKKSEFSGEARNAAQMGENTNIKSATMKVIANVREMASKMQEKLDELKSIRAGLEQEMKELDSTYTVII